MSEAIHVERVVEVRETFAPSEKLRDALVDFINPTLDDEERESLRATFLFKSWRRKLINEGTYYDPRSEENYSVGLASMAVKRFHGQPIRLGAAVKTAKMPQRSKYARIVLRPLDFEEGRRAFYALDQVQEDIADEYTPATHTLLYTEIEKVNLAHDAIVASAVSMLRKKIADSHHTGLYTVRPEAIVAKSTIMRKNT